MSDPAAVIMAEWMKDTVLCNTAATTGKMHSIPGKKVTRADVIANYESLRPLIREVGCRVHIGFVRGLVREFLWRTRPRGKPEAT